MNIAQLHHRIRYGMHWLERPDLVVVGEYHGSNLGDHLLGLSLLRFLSSRKVRALRATLHSLERWRRFPRIPILVGGGNVLNSESLSRIQAYQDETKGRLAFCGVDFNAPEIFDSHRELFKTAVAVSFRSAAQAKVAVNRMPEFKSAITHHPDPVFLSFQWLRSLVHEVVPKRKTVSVNVLPLYLGSANNWSLAIRKRDPFYKAAVAETAAYMRLVKHCVRRLINNGWEVTHVPFAVEDETFSKHLFEGMGVVQMRYTTDIRKVARCIRESEFFMPTRFHALVVGLCIAAPMQPLPYAQKCADLLTTIGLDCFAAFTPNQMVTDMAAATTFYSEVSPVMVNTSQVESLSEQCKSAIGSQIEMLMDGNVADLL